MYKVPVTTIREINPHPNADRLELATVYGFQVVVGKGRYKPGDTIIYVPIDSILPEWLEARLFPADSKIKLNNHRVRQIRIRSVPSQGMIVDPSVVQDHLTCVIGAFIRDQDDLSIDLGIKKYEPPEPELPRGVTPRDKPLENPRFHKYNGLDNIKWYPDLFKQGEEVVIQEKLHGSNCRAALQPTAPSTLWKKILKFVRLLPQHEFCYGSNNVQLQDRRGYSGYYGEDVYGNVLANIDAANKLKPGETIFGELIGEGIQANYHYGHRQHHFVLFDVKVTLEDGTQKYLNPDEVEAFAKERGFDLVPVLYKGPFHKAVLNELVSGPSVYYPDHKVREGVVVKSRNEYDQFGQKRALKYINPDYLDDTSNTDNH
jgi:RNA ligase (TIGR02306 family)